MGVVVDIIFQALAYASVLYLISVGFSVTLGLMGFVNLAHVELDVARSACALICGFGRRESTSRAALNPRHSLLLQEKAPCGPDTCSAFGIPSGRINNQTT
jgi:hypothetical protein